MPLLAEHIWVWFNDLRTASTAPISYQEIQAWAQLTGQNLERWEVAAIRRLDMELLKSKQHVG